MAQEVVDAGLPEVGDRVDLPEPHGGAERGQPVRDVDQRAPDLRLAVLVGVVAQLGGEPVPLERGDVGMQLAALEEAVDAGDAERLDAEERGSLVGLDLALGDDAPLAALRPAGGARAPDVDDHARARALRVLAQLARLVVSGVEKSEPAVRVSAPVSPEARDRDRLARVLPHSSERLLRGERLVTALARLGDRDPAALELFPVALVLRVAPLLRWREQPGHRDRLPRAGNAMTLGGRARGGSEAAARAAAVKMTAVASGECQLRASTSTATPHSAANSVTRSSGA